MEAGQFFKFSARPAVRGEVASHPKGRDSVRTRPVDVRQLHCIVTDCNSEFRLFLCDLLNRTSNAPSASAVRFGYRSQEPNAALNIAEKMLTLSTLPIYDVDGANMHMKTAPTG